MAILGDYINGNHRTILYDDGTRIRETGSYVDGKWKADDADHFTFDFPESFDLKVTNRCGEMCPWCHENSTPDGKEGNLSKLDHLISTIHPGTEIAVGGGDALMCPGIIEFLEKLHHHGIVANLTVNQLTLTRDVDVIKSLMENRLVHGLGISLVNSRRMGDLKLIDQLGPNVVIHVIAGIFEDNDIPFVEGRKVLILGYKDIRRGNKYLGSQFIEVNHNLDMMRNLWQQELARKCMAVAYDNLAIEQLDPKFQGILSDEKYNRLYQGNDTDVLDSDGNMTCSTMYIDLPNMQVARMSTAPMEKRYRFTGDESIAELMKMTTQGWKNA